MHSLPLQWGRLPISDLGLVFRAILGAKSCRGSHSRLHSRGGGEPAAVVSEPPGVDSHFFRQQDANLASLICLHMRTVIFILVICRRFDCGKGTHRLECQQLCVYLLSARYGFCESGGLGNSLGNMMKRGERAGFSWAPVLGGKHALARSLPNGQYAY